MTRAEYEALAMRVEREEPSRELDAAVDCLVRDRMLHPLLPSGFTMAMGADHRLAKAPYITRDHGPAPHYTTSLDAAASLMPVTVQEVTVRQYPSGTVVRATTASGVPVYSEVHDDSRTAEAQARTAAALRARGMEAKDE